MAGAPSRGVWKQLDELLGFGAWGQIGDDELLGRFVAGRRDESAEAAFAALVERHGPMVLGVCRRVLGDRHEAEDAFQATFLVLVRKAGAIARREQLANWLHGVASRTALDARARTDRRRAREQRAFAMSPAAAGPDDAPERGELRAVLDEELARLPASYRGAVVLCELDGLSRQAAARRLGIPEGTLSSRLARAKDLLRHRLTRRGLAPSIVALEAVLSREARALILPPSLAGSTIQAATRVAAGASLAQAVSASVVTLTQGALHTMLLAKIKGVAPRPGRGGRRHHGRRRAGPVGFPHGPGGRRKTASAPWSRSSTASSRPWAIPIARSLPSGMCCGRARPRRTAPDSSELGVATAHAINRPGISDREDADDGERHHRPSPHVRAAPIEARVADLERRFADLERPLARWRAGPRTAVDAIGLPCAGYAPRPNRPLPRPNRPLPRPEGLISSPRARISPRPKGPVSPPRARISPRPNRPLPSRSRTTTSWPRLRRTMTGNRPAGLPTSVPGPPRTTDHWSTRSPRPC